MRDVLGRESGTNDFFFRGGGGNRTSVGSECFLAPARVREVNVFGFSSFLP